MQASHSEVSRSKAGFTLAEVLVALALIALLAAVLLPTVAGQILKGDAGRVQQDLEGIRSGADQFLADVHRYPLKVSQLSKAITTSDSSLIASGTSVYTTGLVSKWVGPYVQKDTLNGGVATGFGGLITNRFLVTNNAGNSVNYLTIVITGISGADFDRIDLLVDGAVGRTTGLLRWVTGGGDTTRYLATPIQ